MIRLFVALAIPEEIKNKIFHLRKEFFPTENNFNWEDENKIHLTLKFIGEVEEVIASKISNELSFLEKFSKINCCTDKFGFFFKHRDEPRILWLGLQLDDSIFTIVRQLNESLNKFNIPFEDKKFKSHLTLLRIKQKVSKEFIDKFTNAEFPKINFTANEITLIQSKLSSQGSTYHEIKKYILK
jgi:2'-5' RNA ligase